MQTNLENTTPQNDMNTSQPQKALPAPTISDRLLELYIKQQKLIITILVVLCVGAGGYFLWMQKTKADENAAALALAKATTLIQAGDLAKAVDGDGTTKGLKGIVGSYGGTPSGNMARLYLGTIFFNSNKPDEALVMYNAFSSPNKDLQASALAGAAACHIQKKAFAEAAAGYEKASAAAENEALKAMYLNKAAESYVAAGTPDKAVNLFDQVIKRWPGTSSAGVSQRSLWRLSGEGVQGTKH
ncbi:MAG: tetratricopeptide repeat protein [Chlorobiaceae bacterium]|nr:tetratricopeptide repeat protein [Chlorobiaceae bacterium]